MELPDNIKIGDLFYDVTYHGQIWDDKKKEERLLGNCNFINCHIKVQPHPKTISNTLLHECVHGLNEFMQIKLTEKQVDNVANGMRMLLLDNPKLLEVFKSEQP